MDVNESLAIVLTAPSPAALWRLRGDLLEAGAQPQAAIYPLIDEFYAFLTELSAKSTSRQYSHLASLLDIGAVGGVVVQNLLDAHGSDIWRRLLTGGFSESLMVLAARQYVKAWEGEMTAVYHHSAYFLYGQLWHISTQQQPNIQPTARRQHLDQLFAPIHDESVNGTVKAVLLGRLFQILLLLHLRNERLEIGD